MKEGFPSVDWSAPVDYVAAIMEGARRIAEEPPPIPCGCKGNPHLVHPDVAAGKRNGSCGNCGHYVVNV